MEAAEVQEHGVRSTDAFIHPVCSPGERRCLVEAHTHNHSYLSQATRPTPERDGSSTFPFPLCLFLLKGAWMCFGGEGRVGVRAAKKKNFNWPGPKSCGLVPRFEKKSHDE